MTNYFLLFLAFLATDKAMATACFCGFPDFISLDMFLLMVFCEYPFFNGMELLVFQR